MTDSSKHKAGFVNIIGKPNVGKSTLMNVLTGESLSIITSKAQTTRHRIMGILNGEDYQIVYSDTPGIIEPKYGLHKAMMRFVSTSLEDADVILFMTDIFEQYDEEEIIARLKKVTWAPIILLINKIDKATQEQVVEKIEFWKKTLPDVKEIIPVSATEKFNTETVFNLILQYLPFHPEYFDKSEMTDKSERFFASEIIREKIFLNYEKEIPYCCEVGINSFKESKDIIKVSAIIFVERDNQKGIIIGKAGAALKKVGTEARIDMEKFFGKKIFLETQVKVEPDWRNKQRQLERFGYDAS